MEQEIDDFETQVVNADAACCAAISRTRRRFAFVASSSTPNARVNRHVTVYWVERLRRVSMFVQSATAARGNWWTPAEGHLGCSDLAGISRWALSFGGEYLDPVTVLGHSGDFFGAVDASYRSSFSASATASNHLRD